MNANQAIVWKCNKCNKYYFAENQAELCCKEKPKKVCEDCGIELNEKYNYTVCDSCREKRRYNRCRKMTIEEYENEFPDCMVIVGDDNYYSSVEEVLEYCDEIPNYVYGTEKEYVEVDIDNAIANAEENAYEDAEFNNTEELYDFVSEWNKRNRLTVFCEAKIVIDIPKEMRKEVKKLNEP